MRDERIPAHHSAKEIPPSKGATSMSSNMLSAMSVVVLSSVVCTRARVRVCGSQIERFRDRVFPHAHADAQHAHADTGTRTCTKNIRLEVKGGCHSRLSSFVEGRWPLEEITVQEW
jgi:hypothetical protein